MWMSWVYCNNAWLNYVSRLGMAEEIDGRRYLRVVVLWNLGPDFLFFPKAVIALLLFLWYYDLE